MRNNKSLSKEQQVAFTRQIGNKFTKKGKTINIYTTELCAGADRIELNKSVKEKVDKTLENKVKVRVLFDYIGVRFKVPTYIYI